MEYLEANTYYNFPLLIKVYDIAKTVIFNKKNFVEACYYNRLYAKKHNTHCITTKIEQSHFFIEQPESIKNYNKIFLINIPPLLQNKKKINFKNIFIKNSPRFNTTEIKNLDVNSKILFVCWSGYSSFFIATKLRTLGYSNVFFTKASDLLKENIIFKNQIALKKINTNQYKKILIIFKKNIKNNNLLSLQELNNQNIYYIDNDLIINDHLDNNKKIKIIQKNLTALNCFINNKEPILCIIDKELSEIYLNAIFEITNKQTIDDLFFCIY